MFAAWEPWQDAAYFGPFGADVATKLRKQLRMPTDPVAPAACEAIWRLRLGQGSRASELLVAAERWARGEPRYLCDLVRRRGSFHIYRGEVGQALEFSRRSLALARSDGEHARSQVSLACHLLDWRPGKPNSEAVALLAEAGPAIRLDAGYRWRYAWAAATAMHAAQAGHFDEACRHLSDLELARIPLAQAQARHARARLWESAGRPREAVPGLARTLFEAVECYRSLGYRVGEAQAMRDLIELAQMDERAQLMAARACRCLR